MFSIQKMAHFYTTVLIFFFLVAQAAATTNTQCTFDISRDNNMTEILLFLNNFFWVQFIYKI